MNIRVWKLMCGLAWLLSLVNPGSLQAQSAPPFQVVSTGTNPVDFEFRADGVMIMKGNAGVGSLLSTDQGAGTRMLWFPTLGAFRVGTVDGTQWNVTNLGQYSVAMGYNTQAPNFCSVALGGATTANGFCATALGVLSTASGDGSLSAGLGTITTGVGSTAMGYYTSATGTGASAFGLASAAQSYGTFVVGSNNVGGGSATTWVLTDPLFEVGNGTPETTPAVRTNALTVYKNGNMTVQGVITAAPGGDIPMFTGN